jgi:hypothetical protein
MKSLLLAGLIAGCGAGADETERPFEARGTGGKADSSPEATFLDFTFSGELLTTSTWDTSGPIRQQLLFTIGQLNGENSVSRLDSLKLSDVQKTNEGSRTRISYKGKMIVAWGQKNDVPSTFVFKLPLDVSYQGQEAFTNKYKSKCVDWSAHDVDVDSMWYYYRPDRCTLASTDVFVTTATVTKSAINTTGKYPEYDKVWEDDALKVVAVFGKYTDGATSNSDAGISAYNNFVRKIQTRLSGTNLETIPAQIPYSPGVALPDVTVRSTFADGRRIEVVALLVDGVRTAGTTFDARYRELSTRADLIAYNGHSGLGANIRALAQKGQWVQGQYVIVFMNGCDTYAYVDRALADAHKAVNPSDDPQGTKYVDIVMNAMPAYFHSDAAATMSLINGLLAYAAPKTFETILSGVDQSQVVLVSGEQDNQFVPGSNPPPGPWQGLDQSGTVTRGQEIRYQTPTLPAGTYVFTMTGTNDADLYTNTGAPATTTQNICSYVDGTSNETCTMTLTTSAVIHVLVRGWAPSSDFHLVGKAKVQ